MKYYSLRHQSPRVDFRTAAVTGQAPDGGLYFPESIPKFPAGFVRELRSLSKATVALNVMRPYVGSTMPDSDLQRICAEAVDFDFPLVPVEPGVTALELFHGPTLAFKDVGARFMSRCLGYFAQRGDTPPVTVLVATSGDTGGAVASGFLGVPGVEVVILYPSGKVSPVQEQQLTTLGQNITALEVDGTFDDCQALVKQAFRDPDLAQRRYLTSANSINVARWLPQQLYYCFAWQQWPATAPAPVVSVPSGNFGNLCAGLLAQASGLPLGHFIAACNANDPVPVYLRTGHFTARSAVATFSNAMDVGNPSNFARILELFDNDLGKMRAALSADTVTDAETVAAIRQVWAKDGYLLDPHGAVAYTALRRYQEQHAAADGLILATAHPVKFPDVVEPILGHAIPLPAAVQHLQGRPKRSIPLAVDYEQLKAYLMA
ncbi:threonine synthase [Hymenobacter sp. BT770]|uniref:threonine synthase n=1 Tax=Hymenobacter sp. BT770 TaxID=2886942 RepID=UPI001D1178F9|nr:threonine synthase [Hymenobacter sp. BT770]MCC3154135.1 threonine synthase [Hymenobacter sp. BT770]MDO3414418.1 threonine synthase [Hymenobacter sp. BT770]